MARQRITKKFKREAALTSTAQARDFIRMMLDRIEQEVFLLVFLDSQHRVIEAKQMFYGTIDGASVYPYPREVVKAALAVNAAAVILAHNHPSGIAEPSQADMRITERLTTALELVDVRVLDHLIVGEAVVSMAEQGLL